MEFDLEKQNKPPEPVQDLFKLPGVVLQAPSPRT
jgi:hypothetical protein